MATDWSLVATISGMVGAVGGLTGAVAGMWSVLTVHNYKSQDLRIERTKLINKISLVIEEIEQKLPLADKSRIRRLAAQSKFQSGEKTIWDQKKQTIEENTKTIKNTFYSIKTSSTFLRNLEKDLNNLNFIEMKVNLILNDLQENLNEDIKHVDFLRKQKHKEFLQSKS